jgi:phage head maturation protease
MRIRLTAPLDSAPIQADKATRMISGTLIPFGQVGNPSMGPARIMFAADGDHILAGGDVWLNREHDPGTVLGKLTQLDSSDAGMAARFSILETAAGNDALVEAAAGARAGLSVEAEIREYEATQDGEGELFTITASTITEAALCRFPAFTAAAVTDVAASNNERNTMPDTIAAVAPAAPATPEPTQVAAAAAPAPSGISVNQPLPTAGEYVHAMWNRRDDDLSAMQRVIRAAAGDPTKLADLPGILPDPIARPVMSLVPSTAPLWNALGPYSDLANTPGRTGTIPMVTTELPDAVVAAELTDMTDKFGITGVAYTKDLIKRSWVLSSEDIAFTSPGAIEEGLKLLSKAVVRGAEKYGAGKLEAVTGTNTAVSLANDGSDLWAKLAGAVSAFEAACGVDPTHFVCARDVWAHLAGLVNGQGQPLIPTLNQTLVGDWGTLFGLPVVVSYGLTAGKGFMVARDGVQSVAAGPQTLRADYPTTHGVTAGSNQVVGFAVASPKFITPVSVAAPAAAAK